MSDPAQSTPRKLRGGLALRLALAIVLFGMAISIVISAGDLYAGYRRELAAMDREIDAMLRTQQPAIERAVWSFDGDQVDAQLAGLALQSDIEFAGVVVDREVRWSAGKAKSTNPLEKRITLSYTVDGETRAIGELLVVADRSAVLARWQDRFQDTLANNAVQVLLVSVFFWLIFDYLLGRHLRALRDYLVTLRPAALPAASLGFERPSGGLWRPDELDGIGGAINTLISNLKASQSGERAASARLKEREAYLDAIVTHAGRAIDVLERDTLRIVDCNDIGLRTLGYTREEYLGLHLTDLQLDFGAEHLVELINAMAESGGAGFTTRHRAKDGRAIDIDLTVRLVEVGGRQMIVNVWADISQQKEMERTLSATRDDLRIITDNIAEALWTADASLHVLYANSAACALSGYGSEESCTLNMADFVTELDRPRLMERAKLLHVGGAPARSEWTLRRKDGGELPVETSAQVLPDGRVLVLGRDIVERTRAEAELRRAAGVFASSVEGILIADARGIIVDVNPAFSHITGYAREDVVGKTPSILKSGRHDAAFYAQMWESLAATGSWRGEVWNRKKDGEIYPEMLSISTTRDARGALKDYVAVFSDITHIKAHEEELNRIAHYDALTGLPNRRLLEDRLRQARSRADRERSLLAVCFLDLDGFKPINDQFGHAAGDQLLLQIAQRLEKTLRGGDTLARMGGDEFVLLLDDVKSPDECMPVLDRVLELVSRPTIIEGQTVAVSASIGVTLYPQDHSDSDALVRHADQAMYKAKELGKNRTHMFDAENDRRVAQHREKLSELRLAFERGEFELFYQPKVELHTGEVIGAEALIRWRRADGKLVSPGEFLPVIEGSPMEVPVSEWVIETALAQSARWKELGLPSMVSANMVAVHLQQRQFVEWLDGLLGRFPTIGRGEFSLEVLESAAIGDVQSVAARLHEIRALGVGLSLDDFGTGYSSLAYLRRLPVDTLKVDQGFVRDMLDDKEALGIVESVVQLSSVFKRRVIAEGVETLAHWRLLLDLGCDYGQGYGIARPMPAGEYPAWVARWQRERPWQEALGASQT